MLTILTNLLLKKHYTITTAESCTGGLVASQLTAFPGSSAWFERGFVTYSILSKQQMLNVPEALIARFGVVSEEVAQAMAEGALHQSTADVALAVTGIAGPSGELPNKPIGTVCFAFTLKNCTTLTKTLFLKENNRTAIRQRATEEALLGMTNYLQNI